MSVEEIDNAARGPMGVKVFLRQVLRTAGLEVTRTKVVFGEDRFYFAHRALGLQKAVVVEFIGPAGVGKSSLAKAVSTAMNGGPTRKTSVSAPPTISADFERSLWGVLEAKFSNPNEPQLFSLNDSISIYRWRLRTLELELELAGAMPSFGYVLSHDGLFHHFLGPIMEAASRSVDVEPLLRNRIVVSLSATSTTILGRRKHRQRAGTVRQEPVGGKRDDHYSLERIDGELRRLHIFTQFLSHSGVPILHLNADSSLEQLTDEAVEWLQTFRGFTSLGQT